MSAEAHAAVLQAPRSLNAARREESKDQRTHQQEPAMSAITTAPIAPPTPTPTKKSVQVQFMPTTRRRVPVRRSMPAGTGT